MLIIDDQTQSLLNPQKLAHGYALLGNEIKDLLELAEDFLYRIFSQENASSEGLRKLTAKTHPDVHFINPSSKTGLYTIEQIKAVCNQSHLFPNEFSKQFFIICNGERMQDAAANALLKTLEEPSLESVFILLVQNIDEIKPTILSRLQKIYYQKDEVAQVTSQHVQLFKDFLGSWPNFNYHEVLKVCERIQKSIDDCLIQNKDDHGAFFSDREIFNLFILLEKWYQEINLKFPKEVIRPQMFEQILERAKDGARRTVKPAVCLEYLLMHFLSHQS